MADVDAVLGFIEADDIDAVAWSDVKAVATRARSLQFQVDRMLEASADTMRFLTPADLGLDEWPDELEDLPERLARIFVPGAA